jgi:hypothetical protein
MPATPYEDVQTGSAQDICREPDGPTCPNRTVGNRR